MMEYKITDKQLGAVIELLSTAAHSRPFNQVAGIITGLQQLPKVEEAKDEPSRRQRAKE